VNASYRYHPQILEQLARHGLVPLERTQPVQLRDAVRDLYRFEIRQLRDRLLAGGIERRHYAGHVIDLRKRYWILSLPLARWTL
jgi:hypothetical protein